jgi:glutamate racemase
LRDKILQFLPAGVTLVSQGEIVAASLDDYLKRHIELETRCSKNGQRIFCTTDSTEDFDNHASIFFGEPVSSNHVDLDNCIPVADHIY